MTDVVVVTGAAGGIGSALMRRFADSGRTVAGLDLPGACPPGDDRDHRVRHYRREAGARGVRAGARRARQDRRCWSTTRASPPSAGLLDHDAAAYRRVREVNHFGALLCTRAALEALTRSRGRLVALSSVAGCTRLTARRLRRTGPA